MSWKNYIFYIFILVSGTLSAQPVITLLTPTDETTATPVIISGFGFNATSENTLAFVGAVKPVSRLSTTTLSPCSNPINVFPHRETFESSDGMWVPGGTASDWTWGSPAKTVINAAGQGNKCWITGGLTNSSYANGENSFLQSPCYDFSSLIHPRITFKIFWETERRYDGASMQYSIDGGTNWNTLGSVNSTADCLGENWFNSAGINFLSNAEGWSGNKQANMGSCLGGNGSITWLTAAHDLTPLAGEQNVSFRFLFGAGTTCNSYDGFAIDDINIFESPPNTANYSYTCQPGRSVDFTSLSICATNSSWNFGDPASGADNTSLTTNPVHIFSAAGTYTVSLTSTFATGAPSTITKQITVLDVITSIDQEILCSGDKTAIIRVTASGSILPYNYIWNTNPAQTTNIVTNIGAGNYSVTVSSGNACPVTSTVIVSEPAALQINPVVTPQRCTSISGAIISNVTGGTAPYTYTWSNGASSADITNLAAGNYSLQVVDSKGCILNSNNIPVAYLQPALPVNLGVDTIICKGQTLTLNPGNFLSYLWQDNSTSPTYTVASTGIYFVTVTDATGCTGTDGILVTVDCPDIYFPTGFTPNGDSRNDFFGPAGNNFFAIKNYRLRVYNRYGQLIFSSTDPYLKWDGKYRDVSFVNESFVWMASYTYEGKEQFKKGVVTLIK